MARVKKGVLKRGTAAALAPAPPKTKVPKSKAGGDLGFEAKLWATADKLRAN